MTSFLLPSTIFVSCVFFVVLVKILHYVPKHYHASINLVGSIGLVFAIIQILLAYYTEQQQDLEKEASQYADTILQGFDRIDDFLIDNYESLNVIFDIMYHSIQIPSSDTNLNDVVRNMDKKTKDILFIIYGKLTILFEKMYLTNPSLFDNDKLGVRVRLYTDNIFFYEYWNVSKTIYNRNFVEFMDTKYTYLNVTDHKYDKPDRDIYRIPFFNDNTFIFKSPTQDGDWR